jgi:hypothetical protein
VDCGERDDEPTVGINVEDGYRMKIGEIQTGSPAEAAEPFI